MTARRTLVSCLKDEGPFLLEWLAYHKAIGFDRFIIGANDCTDGSAEMLARLAALNEITYLPFTKPPDEGAQNTFAELLDDAKLIAQGDWVCWLDLDEFLNIHVGDGQLSSLISQMGPADAMRLNWRIFGADVAISWPGRQLHPDLCHCAARNFGVTGPYPANRNFKTLFRFHSDMKPTPHTPMIRAPETAKSMTWLDGSGKHVRHTIWRFWRMRQNVGEVPVYTRGKPQHRWAQVNHYMTRHPHLAALRRQRGRGGKFVPSNPAKPGSDDFTQRHSDAFFSRYNRTEDYDGSILRMVPATDAVMAALMQDNILRNLHERAQNRLLAHLALQKSGG